MTQLKYNKDIDELERNAAKWWPDFLTKKESSTSIIPKLVESQDAFISILNLSKNNPFDIFQLIEASKFPPNLFLKHLVVLTDFGGEPLNRLNQNFDSLFPMMPYGNPLHKISTRKFEFFWNEKKYEYVFQELPVTSLTNSKLKIDGASISKTVPLSNLYKDVIVLLMFGANAVNSEVSEVLRKCEVGNLIGKTEELKKFIKERYIFVSRITGGAEANTLGQVAQTHVIDFLRTRLGNGYDIKSNGHIEGVTHNDGQTLTTFDVVVKKDSKSVAIEISFQVTTNSTIERKAGQAKARYDMVSATGNYIAYIIDGAGNFQRRNAITTICNNSHCTVAYTEDELNVLLKFILEKLE
jgi:hypothetical protein